MLDQHAAARSERQSFDVVVLRRVFRSSVNGKRWCRGFADGKAADFFSRRDISLNERRGNTECAGDIVETVRRIVRRQVLRRIDIEIQQILDYIRVLGPVQTVQTRRRRVRHRVPVEFVFKPRDQTLVRRGIRPSHAVRWHHPGSKFSNNAFPGLGIAGEMRNVERIEIDFASRIHSGRFGFIAMTGRTILGNNCARLERLSVHHRYEREHRKRADHNHFCLHGVPQNKKHDGPGPRIKL